MAQKTCSAAAARSVVLPRDLDRHGEATFSMLGSAIGHRKNAASRVA